jgi:hypothetical protein
LRDGKNRPAVGLEARPRYHRSLGLDLFPEFVRENYEVQEWRHASSILRFDFEEEWNDVMGMLKNFRLKRSDLIVGGGSKSRISHALDGYLLERGWKEKNFSTKVVIDAAELDSPTHKVDCYKNRVALEIEWNNKDPFFDRDLNNFRLLFDLRAISLGIIVTRSDELQDVVVSLGRGQSFGASTTHMSKLVPRIIGGGGGGCPILVFGIRKSLYVEDV